MGNFNKKGDRFLSYNDYIYHSYIRSGTIIRVRVRSVLSCWNLIFNIEIWGGVRTSIQNFSGLRQLQFDFKVFNLIGHLYLLYSKIK